jgi:hypothetical protein
LGCIVSILEITLFRDRTGNDAMNAPDHAWQSTRVLTQMATRLAEDEDSYLGRNSAQWGTALGDGRHELFVVCSAGDALRQLIAFQQPEYLVLHDLGAGLALPWLRDLAQQLGLPMQQLAIRRQGQGATLATLPFIELPVPAGANPVRVFASRADAPTGAAPDQEGAAAVLLSHSRLAVLLVGALNAATLASALEPIEAGLNSGEWSNRELLFVPTATVGTPLAQAIRQLGAGRVQRITNTQPTHQASGLWHFMQTAWDRLRREQAGELVTHSGPPLSGFGFALTQPGEDQTPSAQFRATPASLDPPAKAAVGTPMPAARLRGDAGTPPLPTHLSTNLGAAPSPNSASPLPMRPMPGHAPRASLPDSAQLRAYVQAVAALRGALAACVFERGAPRTATCAGDTRLAQRLAQEADALLRAASDAAPSLGAQPEAPGLMLQLPQRVLLADPLPGFEQAAIAVLYDAAQANPLLLRMQLQRLTPMLDTKA